VDSLASDFRPKFARWSARLVVQVSRLPSIPWARRRNLIFLLIGSFLGASVLPVSEAANAKPKAKPSNTWSLHWQPVKPVNGSPVVFRVASREALKSLSGTWCGHNVFFSFDASGKVWYGIAGASLETRPGKYPLELSGVTTTGKELPFAQSIAVGKGKYHSIAASVPKQFTEPGAEQLRKIGEDKTLKERVFSGLTPEREWEGNFLSPAGAKISDVFGTSRTFNGQVQSVHQGLDYAVPEGTPVAALNNGTVLLAQALFFEGGCVVLDHGQGLLTLYMHLSKIEVKEGERVSRGQKIGLSGGTGRATGPHLHVAVRWQGIYLNPATLLSLQLP
jgi:murein DD-endopeptidase MepM/ murein hydrolase activator NlpD